MATDVRPLGVRRGMPWSRIMGLRSIYAKTVRDSRRAALVVGGQGRPENLLQFATVGVVTLLVVIWLGNRRDNAAR